MDDITTVQENSSVTLSNNKRHDTNANISDQNSQLKAESTFISNENFDSSKNRVESQTNYYTHNKSLDEINNPMSRLSMHDIRPMNRSNPNRFRPHPSYSYHHSIHSPSYFPPQRMNQPETQAQLVAFTPPLMSIRLPYSEFQTYEQNYCPSRSYMQTQSNEQSSLPINYKSETVTSQPEYYVDSFASNFSDKSSSNSNNKTKTKHVTFQEPNMANELVNTNSNHMTYPLSSPNWTSPTHMYPPSRPSNRHYNPYNYQHYNQFHSQYPNMMIHPRLMNRPRGIHMMSAPHVWTPQSYYFDPQTSYIHHRFQPKQLYDPNKPKVSSTSECHNSSKVIRKIEPKNKKKTKPTTNNDNSTVSISETIPHPITILRKPSTDTEIITLPTSIVSQLSEDQSILSFEEEQQRHQEEKITSSNKDNSDIPSENEQPPICSTIENCPDISFKEEQTNTSSIDNQSLLLPSHELLSILQSANCLSSLNEYAQQKKFTLNYEYSSISPSSFTCIISINGRSFPSSSICSSKNEAQKLACDQTLRILYRESCSKEQFPLEFSDKHDYIAHQSISKFQNLNINELLLGRKTLACMLMITDGQYEQARVISMATGNSCLNETNLIYANDGIALHDCHAEILARRGLIRFLFEQIKQSKDNQSSIFEYNSTINKYQLHDNTTFHMYISSLPCGNASFNILSNSIRYKQGQTEGTILDSTNSIQYSIKSCSDKIYRWNILGIQGGLLINLLTKPIYLESITLACEATFDRNHVKYSLYERLNEHIHSLPSPFICHLPDIDCPKTKSFQHERKVAKLQTSAFAWNTTKSDRMELLEPMTGKLKNDRSMSLLSKRNLFKDFTNFIQTNFPDDNSLSYTTYQQAKQLNKTYVTVKDLISTAFQSGSSDTNISWLSKSDKLEQFSME
ncbi:unnamed protein product [Rotaria sordida]|uniref:Uncharacterized protein n=1 Tax=Rotaria sordida TaxID=392033 RepID=A0A813N2B6_9BILA|nr:unnamed protein product [Rotaria sordida]